MATITYEEESKAGKACSGASPRRCMSESVFTFTSDRVVDIDPYTMNNPYFLYPRAPICGYNDFKRYNSNMVKMMNEWKSIIVKGSALLHISIGAAMEEYDMGRPEFKFQWHQLFPHHLQTAIQDGVSVLHYVVTPNMRFGGVDGGLPYFMDYLSDLDLRVEQHDADLIVIKSNKYDYQCRIVNTMMPTIDERNTKLVRKMPESSGAYDKESFVQTDIDNKVTKIFYETLDSFCEKIISMGGIVTCFSSAVFNMQTSNRYISQYAMFPEIKSFVKKFGPKFILAEWVFTLGSYTVKQYGSDYSINYVAPSPEFNSCFSLSVKSLRGRLEHYYTSVESLMYRYIHGTSLSKFVDSSTTCKHAMNALEKVFPYETVSCITIGNINESKEDSIITYVTDKEAGRYVGDEKEADEGESDDIDMPRDLDNYDRIIGAIRKIITCGTEKVSAIDATKLKPFILMFISYITTSQVILVNEKRKIMKIAHAEVESSNITYVTIHKGKYRVLDDYRY
jgi:hypothetical protein